MDVDILPLAEVDLKIGDVAIKFENDEDKQGFNDSDEPYDSELYTDCGGKNGFNFIKQEPSDYEEFNLHFLSGANTRGNPNDPTRRFQCEDCGKYFVRNEHLKNHKRTHTGERPYECDSCQRSFAKQFDLTRHKQYVHGSVMKFFICEECGRTFSRKDHLKSHLLTHKNQPLKAPNNDIAALLKAFTCETCGRTYCRLENLKKHMQKHFENVEGPNYASKTIVNDIKDEEAGESLFKGINFHFMSANEVGPRGDGTVRPFSCEFCGRLFMRKDHLKNHERTHTGERPFQCDQCDRRFTKRFVMTRHLQNVHRVNTKMHNCSECDRKFARNDHLKTHMKIHILAAVRNQQKEKMHKCEVCDREFTRSDNLKTHMKIHLLAAVRKQQEEEEQEQCSKAELEMENSENSENESRRHDCRFCEMNFSSLKKLTKHEEKHKAGNS